MQPHSFQVGLKLEAVDPRDCHSLGPATVVEVTDKFYFIAEMDSMQTPASSSGDSDRSAEEQLRFSCHRNTPTIFPVGWAASKGIKLRPPLGELLVFQHPMIHIEFIEVLDLTMNNDDVLAGWLGK